MSDLVLNVRQISQYPSQTLAQPSDTLLIQRGGLGGAYYSLPVSGIAGAFEIGSGQIGIGLPLPGDAASTGLIASTVTTSLGCTQGWNWYHTATGVSYLASGNALQECFTASGLTINVAAAGGASQAIAAWSQVLNLSLNGTLTVPGQVACAAAASGSQAATLSQVQGLIAAAVTSFNGRTGAVALTLADVTGAGGAPLNNPALTGTPTAPTPASTSNNTQIATTNYVTSAVAVLQANTVASFNGRVGVVTLSLADVTGVGGAPIASPTFTGVPLAPTATAGTSTTQLATTQFVTSAVATLQANTVASFNGRTGVVGLTTNDITNAGGAPLASPAFTGLPNAPTANPGTSTSQLATTAFVQAAITASVGGVASFNTRTGAVTLTSGDITGAGGALLNSPGFTGIPTVPTAPNNTNTTQIASTAYVQNEIASISAGVTSFNTRSGNVVLSLADVTTAGGAPIASPNLSGIPTSPTAAPGTNTTQIASTAYVTAAINAAVISFNGRTGAITLTNNDITAAGGLSNPSPAITGIPTAPTAPPTTSTTQLATTAFVTSAISGLTTTTVSAPPPPASPITGSAWFNNNEQQLYIWNGSAWVIAVNPPVPNLAGYAPLNSPTFTGTVTIPTGASIAGYLTTAAASTTYAPLASPALTGNPTGVTQPPGNNTTSLATTAFVQAATAPAFDNIGRNLLHNGLLNIQQRGAGPWSVIGYTFDRWSMSFSTTGGAMTTQSAPIGIGNVGGDEAIKNAVSIQTVIGTGGANDNMIFLQLIEDVKRLSGKTVILSFWAWMATGTARIGIELTQNFGTGGSPSAAVNGIGSQSFALTTTPTRFSAVIAVPSAAGKTFGTTAGTDATGVNFWLSAGSNFAARSGSIGLQAGTFVFTGAQLEIAATGQTTPTPLEKLDPRIDYSNCQRFYSAGSAQLYYYAASATVPQGTMITWPVTMRSAPTINFNVTTNQNASGIAMNQQGNSGSLLYASSVAAGGVNVVLTYTASADF